MQLHTSQANGGARAPPAPLATYCVSHITLVFKSVLDIHAPLRPQTRKEKALNKKPWITTVLLKSVKTKNKLFRKLFKSNNPKEKTFYKKYRNKLTHVKDAAKRNYCENLIKTNSKNSSQTSEVESRTQGSRLRPRTQKKSKAKDSLSEDRHSRSQGQECSRPRTKDTSASALQKKKRKVFTKIFQALHKILTIQKIVLSSSRGQANFRGLEAKAKDLTFEAKDFKMCPRGLHLCQTWSTYY